MGAIPVGWPKLAHGRPEDANIVDPNYATQKFLNIKTSHFHLKIQDNSIIAALKRVEVGEGSFQIFMENKNQGPKYFFDFPIIESKIKIVVKPTRRKIQKQWKKRISPIRHTSEKNPKYHFPGISQIQKEWLVRSAVCHSLVSLPINTVLCHDYHYHVTIALHSRHIVVPLQCFPTRMQ